MTQPLSGEGLTARQFETLKVIAALIAERGISPSLSDIAARMGFRSRGAVHRHLAALRERGRIEWVERCRRTIKIVAPPEADRSQKILSWLRAQANAEGDPKAKAAFVEAHNVALAIVEGRA